MRTFFISVFILFISGSIFSQNGLNNLLSSADFSKNDTVARVSHQVSESGFITFANAFRWNHTGPTGGYWNESSVDDYTFRPVFLNVSSYNLIIYSRNGYRIYDSSDIYKGWDGYLKNGTLASQGVYIWKVSGKFSDGTPFSKIGDVTFLY